MNHPYTGSREPKFKVGDLIWIQGVYPHERGEFVQFPIKAVVQAYVSRALAPHEIEPLYEIQSAGIYIPVPEKSCHLDVQEARRLHWEKEVETLELLVGSRETTLAATRARLHHAKEQRKYALQEMSAE